MSLQENRRCKGDGDIYIGHLPQPVVIIATITITIIARIVTIMRKVATIASILIRIRILIVALVTIVTTIGIVTMIRIVAIKILATIVAVVPVVSASAEAEQLHPRQWQDNMASGCGTEENR